MNGFQVRLTTAALLLGLAACGGGDGGGGTTTPQTGSVEGSVTSGGTGVAGVVIGLSSGGSQTTSAAGTFRFATVPVGSHTLTMTPPAGFEPDAGQTASRTVSVAEGQTASVAWSLRQRELPRSATIQMQAASFSPAEVDLAVGGTVRWVNAASIAHTITPSSSSQAGVWANQTVPPQQNFEFSHTFNTAGTYDYSCQIHSGMTGKVRVQ